MMKRKGHTLRTDIPSYQIIPYHNGKDRYRSNQHTQRKQNVNNHTQNSQRPSLIRRIDGSQDITSTLNIVTSGPQTSQQNIQKRTKDDGEPNDSVNTHIAIQFVYERRDSSDKGEIGNHETS